MTGSHVPPQYVVGIGASAGGLEAIQDFFNHMALSHELTFVIMQHLSPDFISMMSDLLAHNTTMPIMTAKENMPLHAGVIYLIPPAVESRIENHCFSLKKTNRKKLFLPINALFGSIARAYERYAVGIILSGTGQDGALGITSIAQYGGLTMVQSPEEAKFSDMPKAAIATQQINYILSVSEMPDALIEYIKAPADCNKDYKQTRSMSLADCTELLHLLELSYKINFASYKPGIVLRRIQRRMQMLAMEKLEDYVAYLGSNPDGLKTLYQDLLIGVSQFFRDADAFACLASEVLPLLFAKRKKSKDEIRIWVNPCATGEEAYTLAILFKEYAKMHRQPFSIRIFASDVCDEFLEIAKKGRYSHAEVVHLSGAILDNYFIKVGKYYDVIPEIRQKVLFTRHNLLRDPPFTKMDLVACRNVLIYINPREQKRVTDLLRFSLLIGGFLFLGRSEGLASLEPDLIVINQTWKIFQKTKRSDFLFVPNIRLPDVPITHAASAYLQQLKPNILPLYVYNAILNDVVTAGFIIDSNYVILHSVGEARMLIVLPEGLPNLILPKIIVTELKAALISALHQAERDLLPVLCPQLVLKRPGQLAQNIDMTVHPICDTQQSLRYYWIRLHFIRQTRGSPPITILHPPKSGEHNAVIIGLEEELAKTKSLLQSSVENMETVNEEIQSTNEELMASNEELQSTNEELQSVNEELYTVNAERSKKIAEVIQAKADIDNLIRAAEICTVILNDKLEIRKFTPAMAKIFNLVAHDIGRPLKNFRHNLKYDHLMVKIEAVLHKNIAYEAEVENEHNEWFFLKIIPYYATDDQLITGVVVTLTDINETKILQQKTVEIAKDLRLTLKTGLIGVWHSNLKAQDFTYDDTIKSIFGLHGLLSMNRFTSFIATIHLDDRKRVEQAFAVTMTTYESFEQKFRIIRPNKSVRYISCSANIHPNTVSEGSYMTGICWDMTEQYWLNERIIDAKHLNLGLDALTDGWWDWDLVTNDAYLSPLLKKTMGYGDHELSNHMESYEQLIVPEDLQLLHAKVQKTIAHNSSDAIIQVMRVRHKTGRIVWILSRQKGILDKQGKLLRMIGTLTDITTLKENEALLTELAYHDALTLVANRSVFLDALPRAIARAKRTKSILAVMFLDVDDFKAINDQWGHAVGDALLREMTHILGNCSRTTDLIARLGGDEFGILLEDIVNLEEARVIASRYIAAFARPLQVGDHTITVTISIGIALYPMQAKSAQTLLKCADSTMYLAKKQGKNRYVLLA